MSEQKVYDLDQVSFMFGAIPIEGGAGEGGFLKIDPDGPWFMHKRGVDGSVTRYKTYNKLTKITVVVLQTSSINAIFMAILESDDLASNGAGVVPIMIRDRQGLSILAADKSWLEGPPAAEYTAEAKDREWTIWVPDPKRYEGGN